AALPNTYGVLFDDGSNLNVVGTSNAADRNIISGNSEYGIFIYNYGTRDNIVEGNFIGTDITGTIAIPNANGIVIDGAPRHHLVKNNVISGNTQEGIVIHMTYSDNHIIVGNKIGTDYTGLNPLGNGTDGIRLAENVHENVIGGSAADANVIAYNAKCGVNVMTADSWNNSIRCNSIYNNGMLGIDLYPEGVNMNDAGDGDAGANNMMNFPVIDSVSYVSGNARLFGHLDAQLPQYCLVDIYKVNADTSGYGEGMIYLGTTIPDAMGNWSDTVVSLNNEYFTATATDSARNTSEFSLIFPEYPFAVNDNALKNISVQISPNPFREKTLVTIESSATKIYSLTAELFSSSGTMIKKHSSSDCSSVGIDGRSLSSGTYFLKLKINNKLYKTLRLIRQ
ncbi:MAG: T9SS type A sorting domain-containing protein, partial [Bacteroidota bacterium]